MLDDLVSSGQSDVWWSYLRTNFIFLSDVQLEKLGQISCWMQFQDESVTQWLLNWMKQQERNFMLGKIVAPLWHTSTLSLLSSSAHSLCSTYLWLSSWTILTILPEIHLSWDLTIWVNLSPHGLNTILEEGKSRNFFANKVVEEKSKKGYVNIWLLFSGKIHYTEVFDMLRSIDPPLGFGKKCPERQAYKKLIRMNMPMDKEGKVSSQLAKKTSPPCLSLFKSLFQKKKENHYSPFFSSSVL